MSAIAALGLVQIVAGFELYPGSGGKKYIVDGWEFKHLDVADLLCHGGILLQRFGDCAGRRGVLRAD